jgi:hypothetical protein
MDLAPTLWLCTVKAPEEVKAAAEVRREAKQSNFIVYSYELDYLGVNYFV